VTPREPCTPSETPALTAISRKPITLPAYEPVPVFAVSIVDGDVYIDPTPIDPALIVGTQGK
jgi:hypothetical protein